MLTQLEFCFGSSFIISSPIYNGYPQDITTRYMRV